MSEQDQARGEGEDRDETLSDAAVLNAIRDAVLNDPGSGRRRKRRPASDPVAEAVDETRDQDAAPEAEEPAEISSASDGRVDGDDQNADPVHGDDDVEDLNELRAAMEAGLDEDEADDQEAEDLNTQDFVAGDEDAVSEDPVSEDAESADLTAEEPAPETAATEGSPIEAKEEGPASEQAPDEETAEVPELAESDPPVPAPKEGMDLIRVVEAILFASAEPLSDKELAQRLPDEAPVRSILRELSAIYASRGVNLVHVAGKWAFRTAPDLGFLLQKERIEPKRLSRAAIETLAIIAYHQPVTRAEIEELRGVSVSKGTLDVLLDVGWARMRGRKPVPGRPITYGTTDAFLDHFGLASTQDLPGIEELKAAGLLDWRLPPDFSVPTPTREGEADGDGEAEDEDTEALQDEEHDLFSEAGDLEEIAEGEAEPEIEEPSDEGEEPEIEALAKMEPEEEPAADDSTEIEDGALGDEDTDVEGVAEAEMVAEDAVAEPAPVIDPDEADAPSVEASAEETLEEGTEDPDPEDLAAAELDPTESAEDAFGEDEDPDRHQP